jgi:hypothetical protein
VGRRSRKPNKVVREQPPSWRGWDSDDSMNQLLNGWCEELVQNYGRDPDSDQTRDVPGIEDGNAFSDVKYIRMIEIARWNTSTTVMESRI